MACCRQTSAMFSVYKVRFTTGRGTVRHYVGYTRCLALRRQFLQSDPPDFLKAMRKDDEQLRIDTLEGNVPTKALALALEALHAARAIVENPRCNRGGPWSKVAPLCAETLQEVRRVARCRALMPIHAIAVEHPNGALAAHLQDLRFVKASVAPKGTPAARGACVTKVKKAGRSGTPGNACRRNQVRRGALKPGSARHAQLHRGRAPAERRSQEYARRQARR